MKGHYKVAIFPTEPECSTRNNPLWVTEAEKRQRAAASSPTSTGQQGVETSALFTSERLNTETTLFPRCCLTLNMLVFTFWLLRSVTLRACVSYVSSGY